ncbi:26S proteasome non-ATPase regulatory subunit 9-like isoform X1 [Coffea eugenioides]|uniref:26S proteasome non-ATPase regulatory subunit 9-like isoform X1 n=1 Tax=Coffea eugenioides TaxID=49369 RepID=UPI000F60E675|nr:26S proteasome non-ATPase regulatory subunit 9-like isoform X1 [Coffea eugenioides]
MVATNLKAETMKLMEQRSGIEAEMNVIIENLCRPGGPGLSGNLLDSEGFPRADIDIPAVRAERHRLAELRNDHKDITEKINQNIQVLHSARLTSTTTEDTGDAGMIDLNPSVNSATRDASRAMDVDVVVSKPFAVVDEITEGSPAAEDGVQLGDQLVKFGCVEFGENLLQRLAAEAQTNQGRAIPVVVLRQGARVSLAVTPRPWQGRGLLGWHIQII